jgi:hypothetical protein
VNETDAQIGANDLEVVVDEGASVVGEEFSGKPPAAEGFFEATQQSLGVGGPAIGGEGNKTRVIVDDHAQMSGDGFGMQGEERTGGEVDDPEVVDAGSFERFGGTRNVLAQQIPAALGIQIILFQPAIDRRESRESGIGLFLIAGKAV